MHKHMQKLLSLFENKLFWLVVLLLVFIPLYPKFPLLNVRGTFVAIRIEDILIAISLGFWGLSLLLSRGVKAFFQDRLNQAILLFFFIGGVSLFSALFVTHTISFNLGVLHYLRRIEVMMLLPFVYSAVKSKKQVFIALATLSVVIFLVSIYALGQKYLNWPVISTGNSEFSKGLILYLTPGARVNSTFAGHYDLAVFLAMSLVVLSGVFFCIRRLYVKAWIAGISLLSFVVLIMTAARLSFVAFIIGVTASLVLAGKRLLILCLIILTVLGLIYPSAMRDRFVSTITVNIFGMGERYASQNVLQDNRSKLNIPTLRVRVSDPSQEASESSGTVKLPSDITPGEPINTTQLDVYRSFQIRFDQEWPRAIRAFIKNPFLGTGYSSLGLATDNDLLRSLGEVGILGTASFGLIFMVLVKKLWTNCRCKDKYVRYFSIGVLAMVIAFLTNALFIDVFEASKVAILFWMTVGLGLAVGKIHDNS